MDALKSAACLLLIILLILSSSCTGESAAAGNTGGIVSLSLLGADGHKSVQTHLPTGKGTGRNITDPHGSGIFLQDEPLAQLHH